MHVHCKGGEKRKVGARHPVSILQRRCTESLPSSRPARKNMVRFS